MAGFDQNYNQVITQDKCAIVAARRLVLTQDPKAPADAFQVPETTDLEVFGDVVVIRGPIKAPGRTIRIFARALELDSEHQRPELNVNGKDGDPPKPPMPAPSQGQPGTPGSNGIHPFADQPDVAGGNGQSAADPGNEWMHGKPGDPGNRGADGGTILLYCGSFPDQPELILRAEGGQGGDGQQGQPGARGGDGGNGANAQGNCGFANAGYRNSTAGGNGGKGGNGGTGGPGGNGGDGGLIVFRSVNEKNYRGDNVHLFNGHGSKGQPGQGGDAGRGGSGGIGGDGGAHGLPMGPPRELPPSPSGVNGLDGAPGITGVEGSNGKEGTTKLNFHAAYKDLKDGCADPNAPGLATTALGYFQMIYERARARFLASDLAEAQALLTWIVKAFPLPPDPAGQASVAAFIDSVLGLNQHLSQKRDYFGYHANHVPVGSVQFYNDALTPLLDSFKALEEKYKAYVSSFGRVQEQHADYEHALGEADALRKELGYQKGKIIEHIGATVSDINATGTEIETSKEALIGKISDLKDGIKRAFGVPDARQFASIAQNLAFMGEGDFSRAMMIGSQSADLFSDFTEAAGKITTDDGTKIDKSYVINRLDVIGRDVADLSAGYTVSQQFVQKNERGLYRLAQKAQQFDDLCEKFYNTSDKARAAESAMEAYLGKIEYRNTKIDEYNALWAKLVDVQGRLDKLNADAGKTQIALARSEDPGLPHRVATVTGLYNRARDACIEYLYWMSRAYMFWALQPSDEFPKICKLSDPDSIDYDTLSSARTQILRDCTNQIQKVEATLRPDAFPAKEADLKVATGITVSMDRSSHPEVIASLRKKGVAEFEIPVATQGSEDNTFAGLANVRLSRVRAWIHGLRTRTNLHFVSITHCGGPETIVTPGNKRIKFVHDPVSVPFRYDASVGVENPRAIFEGRGGTMDGVVLENNYAPIGPFGRWRIAILENNNAGLDRTKIEKVVMEFHGMAELFAKDTAGKPTGGKIRRPHSDRDGRERRA